MLKRRGKYRAEDFARLHLAAPIQLNNLKSSWIDMLEHTEQFIQALPSDEIGCLYYHLDQKKFVAPCLDDIKTKNKRIVPHFGKPGGILPRVS